MKSFREIARLLTIVENDLTGYQELLKSLSVERTPVIGITGPPGAGKSTLVTGLVNELLRDDVRIAVLAVDPTSAFSFGSLLGDRIRMQNYSTHPQVYIRSVATRGSLGGLSGKIIEMTDVLKASGFDYIIVETVGVGQSEVEIASLADISLVVLVPEGGDEVQSLKAGIMEIGDAFIVNKADREGADEFANSLTKAIQRRAVPLFKTVATQVKGIAEVVAFIKAFDVQKHNGLNLMAQKAWHLIATRRMADISLKNLQDEIESAAKSHTFNLYTFIESKVKNS
jgi:LAO/AO transport system kinase